MIKIRSWSWSIKIGENRKPTNRNKSWKKMRYSEDHVRRRTKRRTFFCKFCIWNAKYFCRTARTNAPSRVSYGKILDSWCLGNSTMAADDKNSMLSRMRSHDCVSPDANTHTVLRECKKVAGTSAGSIAFKIVAVRSVKPVTWDSTGPWGVVLFPWGSLIIVMITNLGALSQLQMLTDAQPPTQYRR